MMFQSKNRIALIRSVLVCLFLSGCNVVNEEKNNELLVDYLHIKFTDSIIQMNSPTDTVGIDSFSENASELHTYFTLLDDKLLITRFKPDFHPSDTLRITAAGDTIRRNNWALVYKFDLSKIVSFRELEEKAEEEHVIEWISPPLHIRTLE